MYSTKISSRVLPTTLLFWLLVGLLNVKAQNEPEVVSPGDLKKLSIDELVEIEVTSVSKSPEKLTEVASAIQVITHNDIIRSSATNVAEALRLAPNLQVSQLNSYGWIISARGFNSVFSNKMLVMIDGRTVYTPLFAGVFWDVQNVLLDDIKRIEAISGPGGTIWGANAVNGVVNVIRENAKDTQGWLVNAAAGSMLRNQIAIRYGGKINSNIHYRVYAQHFSRGTTQDTIGNDNSDAWEMNQLGFRLDWKLSDKTSIKFQGDAYSGKEETVPSESAINGQNFMGQLKHAFSDRSRIMLQMYFDRTWRRDIPSTISDELETYDLDFNHYLSLGERHKITWGLGYRHMVDNTTGSTVIVALLPPHLTLPLYSSYIQDDISLVSNKLNLIVGSKFQHNYYTGLESQPSVRIAWKIRENQTLWSAVSRAVRTPSRIDVDYYLPTYSVPPEQPSVAGGPDFKSEIVNAYELGYRWQPTHTISISIATFYNKYDDLYSVEALPGTLTFQIQNGTEGETWGGELAGAMQLSTSWQMKWGYTYFKKELRNKPGHVYDFTTLSIDPENQLFLQSKADIAKVLQLDVTARYVSELPVYQVPDYFTFDLRLAAVFNHVEIAIVGQNLLQDHHAEFGYAQIPRSVYGKITARF